MNGDYSAEDVLTAADVPGFPQGTATVYRVLSGDCQLAMLATLDARGYLRTLDDDRQVIDADADYSLEVAES